MKNKTFPIKSIRILLPAFLFFGSTSFTLGQPCDPIQTAKFLISNGSANDRFGNAVAVDGNTMIIGAAAEDDNGEDSGSVYIYTRTDTGWDQQSKLLPNDGAPFDFFGFSVDLDGDTAIIGARLNDENGTRAGAAYIFTRNNGTWTQQAKLLASDGVAEDRFGYSVSIHGDTAAIGARLADITGASYIFTRTNNTWTQQAKLIPSDGNGGEQFGCSISIHGDAVLIGAYHDFAPLYNSGSAYLFTRNNGLWSEHQKLIPSDGDFGDSFGYAVSIENDTAVIGALWNKDAGFASGSAYVFTRNDEHWTEQAKLLPTDLAAGDTFGLSVSISENTILIGSQGHDDNGSSSGASYIFTRNNTVWTQQAKILPNDGDENDVFGGSVSISGNTTVLGAQGYDHFSNNSGTAYVFDLQCIFCPPDLNNDGSLNFTDISDFLAAFSTNDPVADFNNDGSWNFLDVSAYLADFSAGCP